MNMKNWGKKLLLILAMCISQQTSHTCGYDFSVMYYKFMENDNISDPLLIWFIDYQPEFGLGYSEKAKEPEDRNIEEWYQFLKGKVSKEDLIALIYSSTLPELEDVAKMRSQANSPSIVQLWKNDSRLKKKMLTYLLYAKKCEEHALWNADYWAEYKEPDQGRLKRLMEEGIQEAKKATDPFFKERYAFQAIRMAYYKGDDSKVLEWHQTYFTSIKKWNHICYRALELKAGSLYRMKKAEAPYLYAKIFAECPERREVALTSFKISSQDEWKESYAYCTTPAEKIAFFAMRGLNANGNLNEEIKNMASIDLNHPMIEMLMSKYIQKLQSYAFPQDLEENFINYPRVEDRKALEETAITVASMLSNSQLKNKDYWRIAEIYLQMMLKNDKEVQLKSKQISESSEYKEKAKLLSFVSKICHLQNPSDEDIIQIWSQYLEDLSLFSNEDLKGFVEDIFSLWFLEKGDLARAMLMHNDMVVLRNYLNWDLILQLEKFINQAQDNDIDAYLISQRCAGREQAKQMLLELKGVYFLQRNQLDKAIAEFRKMDLRYQRTSVYFNNSYLNKSIWTESVRNPYFDTAIENQNHNALYKIYPFLNKRYDLISYAEQLKNLEALTVKDQQKADQYFYLLGLAWYNTGIQGWNRPALYFSKDNSGHSKWFSYITKDPKIEKNFKHLYWQYETYYNPDIAANYVKKGLQVTRNKELRAKLLFLWAKIEKSRVPVYNYEDEKYSPAYYESFETLKNESKDTEYYKEILNECYDFWRYVYPQ